MSDYLTLYECPNGHEEYHDSDEIMGEDFCEYCQICCEPLINPCEKELGRLFSGCFGIRIISVNNFFALLIDTPVNNLAAIFFNNIWTIDSPASYDLTKIQFGMSYSLKS